MRYKTNKNVVSFLGKIPGLTLLSNYYGNTEMSHPVPAMLNRLSILCHTEARFSGFCATPNFLYQ